MTAGNIVKQIMRECGISQARLAKLLGDKTGKAVKQRYIGSMVKEGKSMKVDNLLSMLDILGYDVVIKNRLNENEIIVTMADDTTTE